MLLLRLTLQIASWVALAGTILPSCLFLTGRMELESVKTATLAATIGWFLVTPWTVGQASRLSDQERK